MNKEVYEMPSVEVVSIELEGLIAASGEFNPGIEPPTDNVEGD